MATEEQVTPPEQPVDESPTSAVDTTPEQAGITDEQLVAFQRENNTFPETWTDADVLAWYEVVQNYKLDYQTNENGVFFVDPTRAARPVHEWPTEELLLALQGKLEAIEASTYPAIIAEYGKRVAIEAAWTTQQHLDFYRQGVEPAKTSNGVWLVDVTRSGRSASAWSTTELEAWALEEIKAIGAASDAKVAVELKNRLNLKSKDNSPASVRAAWRHSTGYGDTRPMVEVVSAPAEPTSLKVLVDPVAEAAKKIPVVEGLTAMNVSFIDSTLSRYYDAVKPNQFITEKNGVQAQLALEALFNYAIAQEPKAMVASLQRIKQYVAAHLGDVFSPSMAHRYTGKLRDAIRPRHINFVELLRIYADPNKDMRRQTDVRYLLRGWPDAKLEQLVEYFTKIA